LQPIEPTTAAVYGYGPHPQYRRPHQPTTGDSRCPQPDLDCRQLTLTFFCFPSTMTLFTLFLLRTCGTKASALPGVACRGFCPPQAATGIAAGRPPPHSLPSPRTPLPLKPSLPRPPGSPLHESLTPPPKRRPSSPFSRGVGPYGVQWAKVRQKRMGHRKTETMFCQMIFFNMGPPLLCFHFAFTGKNLRSWSPLGRRET